MKKILVLLFVAMFLVSGCISIGPKTSVCDNISEQSYLCAMSASLDTRLEDIGNMLIIANAIAIGQEAYTMQDALNVFLDLRSALDHSVSYVYIRNMALSSMANYPGLFILTKDYLAIFDSPQIMYKKDRLILISWLDDQIMMLGGSAST